jgi:2-phosphosulfolactate phosphatase
MKFFIGSDGKREFLSGQFGVPVIIDVLRASSTIIIALWAGANQVIPFEDPDDALKCANELNAITIGERGGVKIEGFNLNNSPNEVLHANVKGRTVVMTTSNGTRIMANDGIVASTLNAGEVAKQVRGVRHAYLLATGSPLRSDEDLYTATIIEMLMEKAGICRSMEDAIAASLKDDRLISLLDGIKNSGSGKKLAMLGYKDDVDFICNNLNSFPILPVYRDGKIALR